MNKKAISSLVFPFSLAAFISANAQPLQKPDCKNDVKGLVDLLNENGGYTKGKDGEFISLTYSFKRSADKSDIYDCLNDEVVRQTNGAYYLKKLPKDGYTLYVLTRTEKG